MVKLIEHKPKYEALKEVLLQDVIQSLGSDERIPTELALMHDYNLSYSTVSRALKDLEQEGHIYRIRGKGSFKSPRVVATLEKNEHGEYINSSRFPKTTVDIGLVFVSITNGTDYFLELLKGMEDECKELSYDLHAYCIGEKSILVGDSLLKRLILSKQVDGLVIIGVFPERDIYKLHKYGVPFIVIDVEYSNLSGTASIRMDVEECVRVTLEVMQSLSIKDAGVIYGPFKSGNNRVKVYTYKFRDAINDLSSKYGVSISKKFFKSCDYFDSEQVMDEIIEGGEIPPALILDGDIIYEGVLRSLYKHNMDPEKDICLLTIADGPRPLKGISINKPLYQMGKKAIEMLSSMVFDKSIKGESTVFHPEPKIVMSSEVK